MATVARYFLLSVVLICFCLACKAEKPPEPKKPTPVAVVRPKQPLLTVEQRAELHFPPELIAKLELAAGTEAEPFYVTVLMHTENLRGEQGFESRRLAGFSVHSRKGDDLINRFRTELRPQGYLIFKSHKGYGSLSDIISIVKGNSSYDILKIQGTEAPGYQLDTKSIISWLKAQQQQGSFVVTGAGTDWVEAHFIKPPRNMLPFARKVAAFAPDVLAHGPRTAEKLAERMGKTEGFYLEWD